MKTITSSSLPNRNDFLRPLLIVTPKANMEIFWINYGYIYIIFFHLSKVLIGTDDDKSLWVLTPTE